MDDRPSTGDLKGEGVSTLAQASRSYISNNGLMQAELDAAMRTMRELIYRAGKACCAVEWDAIVKAQEKLTEAEMWAKRAIGRS